MKFVISFLLLMLGFDGFQKIADINRHVQLAEKNFKTGNYAAAVRDYELLVFKQEQKKPAVLLNLAHAYFKNNQPEKAQKIYEQCLKSPNPGIRSVAWDQLGTLQTKLPDYNKALTFYKRALVANPGNEKARFNYEMLKKYLRENPEKQKELPPPAPEKQEKQDQPQKEPNQDQQKEQSAQPNQNGNQESDNKDQEQPGNEQQKPEKETNPEGNKPPEQEKPNGQDEEQKEQKQGEKPGQETGENLANNEDQPNPAKPNKKPGKENASGQEQRMQTQYERLRKANISPEKANMMLESMRAAELQYLQQLPKKATGKEDRSKPNW